MRFEQAHVAGHVGSLIALFLIDVTVGVYADETLQSERVRTRPKRKNPLPTSWVPKRGCTKLTVQLFRQWSLQIRREPRNKELAIELCKLMTVLAKFASRVSVLNVEFG
jgi:hypothetical protein